LTFTDSLNGLAKSDNGKQKQRTSNAVEINLSRANRIELPKLKYEKEKIPVENLKQDWEMYYTIIHRAQLNYNKTLYDKAKEEYLKVYDWYHKDIMYYTYLLRNYRKIIDGFINKKKYKEALMVSYELFDKCSNYTNTDINKFNKLANQLNIINKDNAIAKKDFVAIKEPNCKIDSAFITYLMVSKKPKGYIIPQNGVTSILRLKSISNFLPASLPNIEFGKDNIEYKKLKYIKTLPHNIYRFRESAKGESFIVSSKELKIFLYTWNLELVKSFDASSYAKDHTHLRRVELSADLSYFLFTVVDKAYLLDFNLNLIAIWQVPHKEGYEKRKKELHEEVNTEVKECLKILELTYVPTPEEIKSSFRILIAKYHPDKNPNNPQAEEKAKQIIAAYQYLTGEDIQSAFSDFGKEEYYWINLSNIMKFQGDGYSIELQFDTDSGEDWIYGGGISDDGSRIYLGCYSGKIYQINQMGISENIYYAPRDENNVNRNSNPITDILEFNCRKYILSHYYLYILKDDKTINCFKNNGGQFRWYNDGFVQQFNKGIVFYDLDGNIIGQLFFKSPINQVCIKDNIILVETTIESLTFKITKPPSS
jgi:hypothetical protein